MDYSFSKLDQKNAVLFELLSAHFSAERVAQLSLRKHLEIMYFNETVLQNKTKLPIMDFPKPQFLVKGDRIRGPLGVLETVFSSPERPIIGVFENHSAIY